MNVTQVFYTIGAQLNVIWRSRLFLNMLVLLFISTILLDESAQFTLRNPIVKKNYKMGPRFIPYVLPIDEYPTPKKGVNLQPDDVLGYTPPEHVTTIRYSYETMTNLGAGNVSTLDDSDFSVQLPRSSNRTPTEEEVMPVPHSIFSFLSILLGSTIISTVIGNVFVIAAIIIEKHLQNVANYLIVSLAVADLMVACLVMPMGAVYEVSRGWLMGPELCEVWTSSDVLCCTASILHLVAIALDRYWAVTDVEYMTKRNGKRIGIMIVTIWLIAVFVSIAPQFGWKDPQFFQRIKIKKVCLPSQDISYQIFATCFTFYIPLGVILVLYWRIFQAARIRIHKRALRQPTFSQARIEELRASRRKYRFLRRFHTKVEGDGDSAPSTTIAMVDLPSSCSAATSSQDNGNQPGTSKEHKTGTKRRSFFIPRRLRGAKREKKTTLEAKREKKAAKTLAIITGAFVCCWLPFFVMALVMPICKSCTIDPSLSSFLLWLGYFNSTINPVIYTIFSPEFRRAFHRILTAINNSGTVLIR